MADEWGEFDSWEDFLREEEGVARARDLYPSVTCDAKQMVESGMIEKMYDGLMDAFADLSYRYNRMDKGQRRLLCKSQRLFEANDALSRSVGLDLPE